MDFKDFNRFLEGADTTARMPVLFLGHGSPMNAIEENEFVIGFRKIGAEIQRPSAILVISAHWETPGTFITAMENPRTIHDFGGFPKALFEVQYPAPGSPELAQAVSKMVNQQNVAMDNHWGLDHGSWSVVKHLYPNADVPVVQLSINYKLQPDEHYTLAEQLTKLRSKGVLIIGSGNMVHNLRLVSWSNLNSNFAFDWAAQASEEMKSLILDGNHKALINFKNQGAEFNLAVPSPEHYLPMIYALALQQKNEEIKIFNDAAVGGSLTMTSLKIG